METELKTATYDANLDLRYADRAPQDQNAILWLTLKVHLKQINPEGGAETGTRPDHDKKPRKIVKWTPGEWANWTEAYRSTGEKFWDRNFALYNDFMLFLNRRADWTYRAHVLCRFRLKLVKESEAHHRINVVKLDPSETFFRSDSANYDNLDMNSEKTRQLSDGTWVEQRAHIHEIGHILGLRHVGYGKAHCPHGSNSGKTMCYGKADKDRLNIMGNGMALSKDNAMPWRLAVAEMTGKGTKDVKGGRAWRPVVHKRIYPDGWPDGDKPRSWVIREH